MNPRAACLLIGSARPTSTSERLGEYLIARLAERGWTARTFRVAPTVRDGPIVTDMLDAIAAADLLVLASPVYVDSFPYLVTLDLERIAADRRRRGAGKPAGLCALVNCGFPEPSHCQSALDIARCFARATGLAWRGGLALGAGAIVGGQPLDAGGARLRHIRESLSAAAEALDGGGSIPRSAAELMAKPVLPAMLYRFLGGWSWRREAKQHGVAGELGARPYAEAPAEEPDEPDAPAR